MEEPATFAFDYELSQKIPGLLRNLVVDSSGRLYPTPPETVSDQLQQYRDLQYDQLFGRQYLAKYVDTGYLTKPDIPDYNAEFIGANGNAAEAEPKKQPQS